MKCLSKFLAFSASLTLAICPKAIAANSPDTMAKAWATGAPSRSSQSQPDDLASQLRAQWLKQGHTVQQLSRMAAPAITGGKVKASTITVGTAGDYPTVNVSYSTDTAGLNSIALVFAAPNGKTFFSGGYGTFYYTQSGKVKFAITNPLSLYAMPGKWSLAGATIYDNAGNTTTYTEDQLKALFNRRSFTVANNGPFVKAPPKILSGQLLNDTVSLSDPLPLLRATIAVNDKQGPGVYQAFLKISHRVEATAIIRSCPTPGQFITGITRPTASSTPTARPAHGPSSVTAFATTPTTVAAATATPTS